MADINRMVMDDLRNPGYDVNKWINKVLGDCAGVNGDQLAVSAHVYFKTEILYFCVYINLIL